MYVVAITGGIGSGKTTVANRFAELGIDPAFYAYRRREKDEIMPWDVIDCGVTKEFLWREKEKAEKAQTTKDCRKGCNGCGLQRFKGVCKYCG